MECVISTRWSYRPPIVLVLQVIYQCLLLFHAWMPVLNRLVPLVGYRPTLTIAGYLITNVAFVYAAMYLYKLTLYVMENEDQAWRVLCLFCFNPASVFYSSMYPLFCSSVNLNLWKTTLWCPVALLFPIQLIVNLIFGDFLQWGLY